MIQTTTTRHRNAVLAPGLLLLLLGALGIACGERTAELQAERGAGPRSPLRVAVVHYPLAYFAGRIGGEAVEVVFPVPEDEDPAFWRPDPEDVARFQDADLILRAGAGYAGWVRTASLPPSRVVDTSASYAQRLIERTDLVSHRHGPRGEHTHGELAFTTWLDLELAILQAAAVRDALVDRAPGAAADFGAAFDGLEQDLRALDQRLAATIRSDRPVLFSHPVYDYLARRYGIDGTSLHWEPDEQPGASQWSELDAAVARSGAAWMIWEDEPLPEVQQQLEQRGIRSVIFPPCGNRPASGDLLQALTAGAEALEQVFGAR